MRKKTKNHCKKTIFVTLLVATEKIVRILFFSLGRKQSRGEIRSCKRRKKKSLHAIQRRERVAMICYGVCLRKERKK
jgi:hypothetical protein